MEDKRKVISQDEIDGLGIKSNIPVYDDIKNMIILIRNELNSLDKEVSGYEEEKAIIIKKNLNSLLEKIINIRR